jgi:polyphosphate glucokinase
MEILVIDIGGTNAKLWHTSHEENIKVPSGKEFTPEKLVGLVREATKDWQYEAIALGLPCRVSNGKPVEDPQNLGAGWLGYNYSAAFGLPVRVMNDASLQALGSYDGGRMLFIGLGTAVGSSYIAERLILSLDLGRMTHSKGTVFELLGDKGLEKLGTKKAEELLHEIVPMLKAAMMADYVVLGGGSAKKFETLPDGVRRGHNRTVVEGGRKLWEELNDPTDKSCNDWVVI